VLRAQVERLATAAGIPVVEAWARVADLRPDDGVLLTSSVRGVVPVERVDGVRLLVHEQELAELRARVADAEAESVAGFRATYL
jgi:branched-subunit amino acid aminotransferase/4-amino-4-deoxychorismate lyase